MTKHAQPVRIVDLARQMIQLSGLKPDEDVEIVFTGLRPGEKLHEELWAEGTPAPTSFERVFAVHPQPAPADFDAALARLEETALARDHKRVLELLQAMPIGFCTSNAAMAGRS